MQDIAQELIKKASLGDMPAFEAIYKALSGFVYSIALRISTNSADAEDITQEVFLKIYDNLARFEFRSSFKTWVYRITFNTALNFIKRTKKDAEKSADNQTLDTLNFNPQGFAQARGEDFGNLVQSLLKMLNAEQRACIILREIEGLSYKDISKTLNVNINTVRSRLKRARISLMSLKNKEVIQNEL